MMSKQTEPFSLPSDARIGCIQLKVSNLEQSLAFYSTLLGFQVLRAQGDLAALSNGLDMPGLIELSAIRNAHRKPPRTTGLYHAAVRLPNRPALGALLKRLLEHNYPLQGAADHVVSEAIYLADPDGNGLELYADRPRQEWRRMDGQIAMATDPLDVQAILSDASPSWDGIHPGTDIGHIHLQVSDLSRAEEFYCGLVGFEVTQRSYPGALFVSAGGYHHHLGLNTWAGRSAPPPPPDAVGLGFFQIVIPDKAARMAVLERLAKAGIDFRDSPNDAPRFHDPDGNLVEI